MEEGPLDATGRFGLRELRRGAATSRVLVRHGARATRHRRRADGAAIAAREARDAFAELGPTYVKLAQLIASSPGLFPEVLSEELRTLLDRVPPIPYRDVATVIRSELGADPCEVFAWFNPEPLASASIAQVHTATLHNGRNVVVKIQRPGTARSRWGVGDRGRGVERFPGMGSSVFAGFGLFGGVCRKMAVVARADLCICSW